MSPATVSETRAMERALELAWRGWGHVHPNPMVGCVLLKQGRVVGEGYHAEYGGKHAEVVALEAAGERARGATAVVNLEPCNHRGKTPPCIDALLKAGIKRVVAAVRDPTEAGRGAIDQLRAAGVTVSVGLLERQACIANAPFFFTATDRSRPFVALKLATSLDGRLADAEGRSQWITGEEARAWAHWLRAGFEAITVGGTTALTDDPHLTVRGDVTPRQPPVRVVFDRRAMLNPGTQLVRSAREVPTWVVASLEAPASNAAVLEAAGVRVLRPRDLRAGLSMLREEGISTVLCEGGGHLGSKLLAEGLVDRLYWLQAPIWLGEHGVSAFARLPDVPLADARRWIVVERRALGDDTLLVVDRTLCLPGS